MKIWVDTEITFQLINESPLQERLFNEFAGAHRLGLSLVYPIAVDETAHAMASKLGGLLSRCSGPTTAWKLIASSKGIDALGGFQHVGASGDYTIKLDRGDYLSMLGSTQDEMLDASVVSAELDYLTARWASTREVPLRTSAIVAWIFARAYRADAIYTRSATTVQSLTDIFALTQTKIRILNFPGPLSLDLVRDELRGGEEAFNLLAFDAFARRFGDLVHNVVKDAVETGAHATIRGQMTLQPTFGTSFQAEIKPAAISELLPTLIQRRLLNESIPFAEARKIIGRLDEIATLLSKNNISVEETRRDVAAIMQRLPESKSLFEDIVSGASGSLLASNIIEGIKLALGG